MPHVLIPAFEIAPLKVVRAIIESRAIPMTNESKLYMEKHWLTVVAKCIDPTRWMDGWMNGLITKYTNEYFEG